MNRLRGIPLEKMRLRDLRATISVMSHQKVSGWSKRRCIEWLTKHDVRDVDVGRLCRALLRVVLRKNSEGFNVGLHYRDMVAIVHRHFPDSAVDERHFSWYATTMRAAGETIPVYREPI